uniref:Rab interacting lysosomal protein n=1 Tax=Junco hyemalis TaxID=40217 RepID=A0A8C5J329_JUNHY
RAEPRGRGAMAEPLWRTPPARLAPPHVYRMAGALGAELRRLSARFGPDAVAGLVPPVVRLLELLEALVAPPEHVRLCRSNDELDSVVGLGKSWGTLTPVLCVLSDSTARKEREVMLRLKEVVDRQRDELRAQAHEIVCKSRDTEALQEQLQRFMAMNEELRHKVAVVQAQLKSALEQKSDLEAAVLQSQRETSRRSRTALQSRQPEPEEPQHQDGDRSPAHCCFSKEELQQILQERNELKTNLFLVQEELAYYQRGLTAGPPPHCSLLAAQHGGGLHPLPSPHPKRDLPSPGGSLQTPLLTAHSCPILLCGFVLPHPFL